MIKKAVSFLLVILLFVSAGCSPEKIVRVAVDDNKTVGLRPGQLLKLEFVSNASTGYTWQLTDSVNKGIARQIGTFRYINKSRDPKLVGAPGVQIFRCEAMKRGKAKLVFEYLRPWEKDKPPAEKYIVKVIVH
ncbi:MAG: protease inhibitor I42 family protein [Candidatus Omnitrophota bacterium]